MPMTTLTHIPDVSGRRFGQIMLGYDNVIQIRDEVSALQHLASAAMGVPVEELTTRTVADFASQLRSQLAGRDLLTLLASDQPSA